MTESNKCHGATMCAKLSGRRWGGPFRGAMEYCVASLDPGMGKRARSTAFSDGDGRSIRPHGGNRIEELRMAESVTAMDHLGIHGSMCIHERGGAAWARHLSQDPDAPWSATSTPKPGLVP